MMPAALSALPSWAQDAVRGTAVLSAFLVAMVLVRLFWRRIVSPLASRTKTQIDGVVLLPLRSLVLWGLFLLGLSQSARAVHAVRSMRNASAVLDKGLAVAWVLVLVWTAVRLVSLASSWYQHRELQAGRDLGSRVALIRKVSAVLVFALGFLYLLRILNVQILLHYGYARNARESR